MNKKLIALMLCLAVVPVWADDDNEQAEEGSRPLELEDWGEYVEVEVPYVPESNTVTSKLPLTERLTPASLPRPAAPPIGDRCSGTVV